MKPINKKQIWYGLLRVAAIGFGIAVAYRSVEYSQAGFEKLQIGQPGTGRLLAYFVIYLQLVFNRGTKNPTLYYLGLGSYLYSIGTNIAGMYNASETVTLLSSLPNDASAIAIMLGEILRGIVVIAFAVGMDLGPEAVIVWGLFDDDVTLGDFVSSLVRGVPLDMSPRTHADNHTDGHTTDGRTYNGRTNTDNNTSNKAILNYAIRNISNGRFPSVRDVATALKVDKNRVSEVLRPHRNKYERK